MSKRLQRISDDCNGRWAAYVAAGLTAFSGAQQAEADITHVVVDDQDGRFVSGEDSFSAELDGATKFQIYFDPLGSASGAIIGMGANGFLRANVINNQAGGNPGDGLQGYEQFFAENISAGEVLNQQDFEFQVLANAYSGYGSQFNEPGIGYIGFQFDEQSRFGWAMIEATGSQFELEYQIKEFAFGDVGDQVSVGQTSLPPDIPSSVPESTSLGLLALGAVGVLISRRNRQKMVV